MVHIEKVDSGNIRKLLSLEVNESRKNFVATNTRSIAEAYLTLSAGGNVFPFGIFDGNTPVGFLMIGYGDDETWENEPEIAKHNYSLWRLMIDKKHQHKGYGRKALELALDFVKSFPCGRAEYFFTSYDPDNVNAKKLYNSFGFTETGDFDEDEAIAVLKL